MNMASQSAVITARMLLAVLASVPHYAYAQTPQQMEYERQQREYRQQQEQQRQEQQRQQQLMNENARRQQEESRRLNAPPGSGSQNASPGSGTPTPGRSAGGSQAASDNLSAARAAWQKKPPLPPEQNPLLGAKWTRPASTQGNSSDPFAALAAMAKGGLCDVLFGGGTFEFRTDRLMGMDART